MKSLKETLVSSLNELMNVNQSIHLIDVDLGSVYGSGSIKNNFPERYHQAGIAEQNAIGIAAGLGATGKIPIVISLSCFITGRCFDQIRLNFSMSNFPGIIIGLHAGSFLGQDGPTHQSRDDLGLISSLPNIKIYTPSTHLELKKVLEKSTASRETSYIRLFFPPIKKSLDKYSKLDLNQLNSNHSILCHGYTFSLVESAIGEGNNNEFNLLTVADQSDENILKILLESHDKGVKKITVIEDNFYTGSLYSKLLRMANENSLNINIKGYYSPDRHGICGTVEEVKKELKLEVCDIVNLIKSN